MRTGFRACVFDAVGTLVDFASAAAGCAEMPDEKAGPLTTLWRDRQLRHSWRLGLQGRDAHAATAFGMQVVWCNRDGQRRERLAGASDHAIRSPDQSPGLLAPAPGRA